MFTVSSLYLLLSTAIFNTIAVKKSYYPSERAIMRLLEKGLCLFWHFKTLNIFYDFITYNKSTLTFRQVLLFTA